MFKCVKWLYVRMTRRRHIFPPFLTNMLDRLRLLLRLCFCISFLAAIYKVSWWGVFEIVATNGNARSLITSISPFCLRVYFCIFVRNNKLDISTLNLHGSLKGNNVSTPSRDQGSILKSALCKECLTNGYAYCWIFIFLLYRLFMMSSSCQAVLKPSSTTSTRPRGRGSWVDTSLVWSDLISSKYGTLDANGSYT